jgi:hypothetical protein
MTNTIIISKSPEFFYKTTKTILKHLESLIARHRNLGPVDLAFEFYEIVFDEKSWRTNAGLLVPGRWQDKHVVKRSVDKNLFALCQAFEHIDTRLASDPHCCGKAVVFLGASHH